MSEVCLDLAVPETQLQKEEGLVSSTGAPKAASKKGTERTKLMTEFYKKHDVAAMVSRLTAVLMRDKPADPIAHIIQHLVSPEVAIPICDDVTPYMNQASAEYLLQHRIHYMFDEFLNNMVDDAPVDENGNADIVGYAMTWMRWNKKRFALEKSS